MRAGADGHDLFVGRTPELARLHNWRGETGKSGFFVVAGDPGVGKSRLAAEFVATVPAYQVIQTAISPTSADNPFEALLNGLGLGDSHKSSRPTSMAPTHADARYRIYDLILDELDSRAVSHEVLLVVDDAQWVDEGTLACLIAATQLAAGQGIRVLVLLRPVEPMAEQLAELVESAKEGGTCLELSPLTKRDVADLAALRVSGRPGEQLLAALAGTGGNPLVVAELLDSLERRGELRTSDGVTDISGRSHSSVRPVEVVLDRIADLSADARAAARCGSVIGRSFKPADLQPLLGWSATEVVVACEELITSRVVSDNADVLSFRHDLLRETIYEDMEPWVRQTLHRQFAAQLVESGREPIVIARHLEQAEPDASMAPWFEQAGIRLLDTDPRAASQLLQRALDLASTPGEGLLRALGQSLVWTNRADESLKLMAQHCDSHGRTALGGMRLVAAQAHAANGHLVEAAKEFEAAAPLLSDPAREQQAVGEAQILRAFAFEHDSVIAGSSRVLETPGLDPLAEIQTRCALGWALKNVGRIDESIATLDRAVELAGDSPDLLWRNPLMFLVDTYIAADRFDEFADTALAARSVALEYGDVWQVPSLSSLWAGAHMRMGQWDKAVAEADAGIAWARETGNHLTLPWLLSVKAVISMWRGDVANAEVLLGEAEAELDGELRSGAEVVLWARVQLAVMSGDLDEAVAGYELIWALIRDLGLRAREATVAPGMARVLLLAGQDAAAAEVRQTLATTRQDCGGLVPIRGHEPAELWVQGLIDRDAGAVAQAARSLGEIGLRVDEALAGLDAVEIAVSRGEGQVAEELGIGVAKQLDQLGAKGLRKRLDSLVSVPAVIEPTSALGFLSAAERRVADLVSTGASNPEIAEKLFVSRRTIESHVSHIFTKLGITSRVELAVLVSSED